MRIATLVLSLCLFTPPIAPSCVRADEPAEEALKAAAKAFAQGRTKEALVLADRAVSLDPKNAGAYHARGQIRDALGRYADAVADFSKVVQLDPKAAEAYDRRGSAHFKLGEFAKSVADFDRYLELRPAAKAGHWRRGISCYYAKKFDEGRKQFEGYEAVDTNDVENAVWRYLCMAPVVGIEKARTAMLEIGQDRRVPMMLVYDLFRGKAKPADVLEAVAAGKPSAEDLNRRRFYAELYLGLYYESLGDGKRALQHLSAAAEHRIGHYMWYCAVNSKNVIRRKLK